jgi:phage-related protein
MGGDQQRPNSMYSVRLSGRIYVLHVFQKKSRKGIATRKSNIELIQHRLRQAIVLHENP